MFVCLLRDVHELLQVALGCISHVAATIVALWPGLGENLNKLVALQTYSGVLYCKELLSELRMLRKTGW